MNETPLFYINLDSRPDRKTLLEKELNTLGWEKRERIRGVPTKDGAVGCLLSHIKALKLAKERAYDRVAILEDDIVFQEPTRYAEYIDAFLRSGTHYDVLMMTVNYGRHAPLPPPEGAPAYIRKITFSFTGSGYIVAAHYIDTLIANFEECAKQLIAHPTEKHKYALDVYWAPLQRDGTWLFISPRTVSQRAGFSDIEKRVVNYEKVLLDDGEMLPRLPQSDQEKK